jgi:peptide chain release factor 2
MSKEDVRAAIRRGSAPRTGISFGKQIRSYVLDKGFVKDHRTGLTSGDPDDVLNGGIDKFIEAEIVRRA